MKKGIFIVAAVVFSSHLYGQIVPLRKNKDSTQLNAADDNPAISRTLDKVVITANKYPRKQSQTGKVITVIDKEMLEKLPGRTTGEILNTVAGVTVNGANNNLGTNQRISIRGASDGNVLLLIDGLPVNDPSVISNYFDLNFINTSQIERIELLKGGQSTLYGSDAVSGVINVVTKKTESKKFIPSASISYGSYKSFNGNIAVNGQTKTITYNLFASHISSAGFSSAYDSTGNKNFDKDSYHQYNTQGNIGIKITDKLLWNVVGSYSLYKADADAAAFKDDKDFFIRNKNLQLGSGIAWKQKNGDLQFNYQYNYLQRFYLDDSTDRSSFAYYSKSIYTGRTHFAELYDNYQWRHVSLLAGLDYRFYNTNQVYHSLSLYGPFDTALEDSLAKMWQISSYISVVYHDDKSTIEGGGRLNHHNIYGNNTTFSLNPSYRFHQKIKVFANLSSAFKTPSLFQLFDAYSGNKKLNPEKTISMEGGVEVYMKKNIRLRLTGFFSKTNNAIQYIITDPTFFTGHYENVNYQKNSGIESEFTYARGKWNINANYTYTKGHITSRYSENGNLLLKDTSYNNLYRVPDHSFNALIGFAVNKKMTLNCNLKYTGKRWEPVFASPPNHLDDYWTADISAHYRFNKQVKIFVSFKNITNQQYFDILGYNSKRFNMTTGINFGL
jgi:vitamin B12 transporter